MYSFEEIQLVWKYFFLCALENILSKLLKKKKWKPHQRCSVKSIHKTVDYFWMTSSVLEKNKIRKHYIYLKINCITLAPECKNPQKISKLDRLFEACCRRSQLKVGVWCILSARKLVQIVFFQGNNKEIAHCDFRASRFTNNFEYSYILYDHFTAFRITVHFSFKQKS